MPTKKSSQNIFIEHLFIRDYYSIVTKYNKAWSQSVQVLKDF